jgi:hypothetical protein
VRKVMIILLTIMTMVIVSIPASCAIVVDGIKSPGEWNDAWAYGQDHAATPVFPYGDRLEIVQNDTWYQEDPKNDSGMCYCESMATNGSSSGMDIKQIYAYYDYVNDTAYAMATVYGIPGDLDGDGDAGENCIEYGDCNGDFGPAGTGIGEYEAFTVVLTQGTEQIRLLVQNNNWTTTGIPYNNVNIKYTTDGPCEISIKGFKDIFDISLGAPAIQVKVTAGGIRDIPGEDTATAYISFPPPGKLGDFVWIDLDFNGIQDNDEPGIPGVNVNLHLHGGRAVATATTNATGYYSFDNLLFGCYDIVLDPSNFQSEGALYGFNQSPANLGDDTVDSDGIDHRIDNRCLIPGAVMEDLTNDFGFCQQPVVPVLSPSGLMVLSGLLGVVAIFGIRLKR